MNSRRCHLLWPLVIVVFGFTSRGQEPATAPAAYTLPDAWVGTKEGTAEGNPQVTEGKPVWRLDHIWPDDWRDIRNYKPLVWMKGRWGLMRRADGEHMSRPQVQISHGDAILNVFASRWGGIEPFSNKAPALVFIAPATGAYIINAVADAKTESGAGSVRLLLLKNDRIAQKVKKIADEEIKSGESLNYANLAVELHNDDELIFVPLVRKEREGGTVELQNLRITLGVAATKTPPSP